mmetsp:Transcript_7181/g.9730  ORF Transcript_7181/g.9730 Transcript_7181/m.9730 type:complete len:80 (-) Transcript_7181:83-322(-)
MLVALPWETNSELLDALSKLGGEGGSLVFGDKNYFQGGTTLSIVTQGSKEYFIECIFEGGGIFWFKNIGKCNLYVCACA